MYERAFSLISKNYFETTCTNGYKIGGISGKLPMDTFTPAVTQFKLGV